jgi:predicted dehydrogenase
MVRVGVVGCGYWGPNLIRNIYQLDCCDLAMICDADPQRLARVGKLYPGVTLTTSFQDVLDSGAVDAVVIATPARTHHAMTGQALAAGKHVLVEKPLAVTSPQCQDLISLAKQQGLVLMVGHTFLYNPALLMVKELSQPEYLGDLFYLYSHRVNLGRVQTDVNALWSIAPHDISIALFLVGQAPEKVSAQGAYYLSNQIEDVVFITLTFPGGVMGHIHVSWIDPSKTRKVTVVGSEKMIIYDDLADEGMVKVYDKGVKRVSNGEGPQYGEFQYRLHSGDVHLPRIRMTEPLANECRHFIECILENKTPTSDGENGLQVVQVLEAAQRSIELQGMPMPVASGQLQPHTVA